MDYHIRQARPQEASVIAKLIMTAMNSECCLNLAGPGHTLEDFHKLMTKLVASSHSQYSYLNTIVATDADDSIMGMLVAYDGSRLLELRQAFIDGARKAFGIDHSGMKAETQPGEYYLDSLCVAPDHRHKGIATALLRHAIEQGRAKGLPATLLVDKGNPKAEALYRRLGFVYVSDTEWGGHAMKRLAYPLQTAE